MKQKEDTYFQCNEKDMSMYDYVHTGGTAYDECNRKSGLLGRTGKERVCETDEEQTESQPEKEVRHHENGQRGEEEKENFIDQNQ
jgi:hypothetical protein